MKTRSVEEVNKVEVSYSREEKSKTEIPAVLLSAISSDDLKRHV
jgi:hypothetical protein